MADANVKILTGGCLCGAVRLRISAEPILARVCWCRLCQTIGAGGPTVNVCFPVEAVELEGPTNDFACVADSGSHMHRRFCPTCGVHLVSTAESRPHLIFIRAGALDDREVARPAMTIWTEQAPSWACFDPDLPQMVRQPPPAA